MRRARAQIKEVVNQSLKDRSISDVDGGRDGHHSRPRAFAEPRFHHAPNARASTSEKIFTGNKEFKSPATRSRSRRRTAAAKAARQATRIKGDGEDEFQFMPSRSEEFLDLFFDESGAARPGQDQPSRRSEILQVAARRLCA